MYERQSTREIPYKHLLDELLSIVSIINLHLNLVPLESGHISLSLYTTFHPASVPYFLLFRLKVIVIHISFHQSLHIS